MTQLSEHFSLREMTFSENAARHGVDNTPSEGTIYFMRLLCEQVLEPIRAAVSAAMGRDVPLHVNSGYRSPVVNALAKGSANSDHMSGRAADLVAINVPLQEFAKIVIATAPRLPIKQVIVEYGRWLHVSHSIRVPAQREFLVATLGADKKTIYTPWESAA